MPTFRRSSTSVSGSGRLATYGAGRYEVIAGVGGVPIRPGGKYTLTVRATDGTVVTGSTVVHPTRKTAAASAVMILRIIEEALHTFCSGRAARSTREHLAVSLSGA